MAADTIIMIALICIGAGLGLAGLSFAGYRAAKLVKASRAAGVESRSQVQVIAGRVQRLAPRVREIQAKQKAVAEGLERLSTTANESD